MSSSLRFRRFVSLLLFGVGVLGAMALVTLLVWADMEASLFDPTLGADGQLNLSCPAAIGTQEVGIVRAKFPNESDNTVTRSARIHVAEKYITLLRGVGEDGSDTFHFRMQPREVKTMEWSVTADDAVWGRLVMTRAYLFRNYPQPSKTGSCGILVFPVPVPGIILLVLAIVAGWGCMLAGWIWWEKLTRQQMASGDNNASAERGLEAARSMVAMLVAVTAALVAALLGVWLLAGILLVGAVVLVLGIAGHFIQVS